MKRCLRCLALFIPAHHSDFCDDCRMDYQRMWHEVVEEQPAQAWAAICSEAAHGVAQQPWRVRNIILCPECVAFSDKQAGS